jgi:hypothetical protein
MVCPSCGNPVLTEVYFCPKCGAQVMPATPVTPPSAYTLRVPRVRRNLQSLGVVWCLFGAYRIIEALVGIFVLRIVTLRNFGSEGWIRDGWARGGHFYGPWMSVLLPIIALAAITTSILAFLVGFALLTRKPWGRVLAIVLGALALFKFPIGTALGIYTLWVLSPAQSGAEYDSIADHS